MSSSFSTTTRTISIIFGVLETRTKYPETFFDLTDFDHGNPPKKLNEHFVSEVRAHEKNMKFRNQVLQQLLMRFQWFLVVLKDLRICPRRFSICTILVGGSLRFTSSKSKCFSLFVTWTLYLHSLSCFMLVSAYKTPRKGFVGYWQQ